MSARGDKAGEAQVLDAGHDIVAATLVERGLHFLDHEALPWRPPARRPVLGAAPLAPGDDARPRDPGAVEEKFLVYPLPGEDRFPISIVKFPPNHVLLPHWHTEGGFICVLRGTMELAGAPLAPGTKAYIDARTVYAAQAGDDGCEFLILRRAWAETHMVDREPNVTDDAPSRVTDASARGRRDRGVHVYEIDSIPWTMTLVRPLHGRAPLLPEDDRRPLVDGELWEKALIYPLPGEDRFPISIIRFPPNFTFARHWHTDGEFVMVLSGTANFAGRELRTGAMAYNDARTVYGAESAGPKGCDFLLIRRAWAETHVVT